MSHGKKKLKKVKEKNLKNNNKNKNKMCRGQSSLFAMSNL